MDRTDTVQGVRKLTTRSSPANAFHFMIETMIRRTVNTAEVVRVVAVASGGAGSASGHVDVLPLVCHLDASDRTIQPAVLYRLPYSRIQGGRAALVIDPVPGDIGLAVFAKRDSSAVGPETADPAPPASFRCFDLADGFYVGGFLNQEPSIFLELAQDNAARLVAPKSVTIETADCAITCRRFTVNASVSAGITTPSWSFDTPDGGVGRGSIKADLTHTGSLASSGDHTAGTVSLTSHVHGGVQTGNGSTGNPQ